MFALPLFIFKHTNFKNPLPKTAEEFNALDPRRAASNKVVSLARARFKMGDRVLCGVGRIPKKHYGDYLMEDGIGEVTGVAMMSNGISEEGEHTRIMYQVKFEKPVKWAAAEMATEVVVEQGSLMSKA